MDFLHRTWVEIDTNALKHNFEIIKSHSNNSKIMAVVKANAYGHSVKIVAPLLDKWGADCFAVSNIEEAEQLREIGIKKPVLIFGYTPEICAEKLAELDITQAVYSREYGEHLSKCAKEKNVNIKIHIKLDTGMGRIGFDCRSDELKGIEDAIRAAKFDNFIFDGVFTHFAVSDSQNLSDIEFTDIQFDRFMKGIEKFKEAGLNPNCCHCSNSAAFCLAPDKHIDMSRPGIILYGLTPSDKLNLPQNLMPVMTLKTVVSMVKNVEKGEPISYGRTYFTDKKQVIATLAVGYADGYNRLLSNKGYVIIKGKKAPIVGKVCMDQMTVDITGIENVSVGDEVILFGKELPVEEISALCDTINYETVCAVSSRVKRIPV